MAMTPRLDLRQTQTLVMTPQLQQAIKLLQLSNMELLAYVEQEIEQNPLLERDDGENDGLDQAANGEGGDAEREEAGSDGSNAGEADPLESVDRSVANDRMAPEDGGLDVDYDNVWTNDSTADRPAPTAFEDWGSRGGGGFDGAEANLEETLSGKDSLGDHLLRQLHMDIVDPVDRLIGLHLFDMLDEAGYITGELAQVAGILDCDVARVELTLASLQQFDPPGIFARSLAECLALQLRDRDRLDPAMQTLLDNLDLLARRDVASLTRLCGVDAEEIADMVAEIRALDPKPGLAFDSTVTQPITPDIMMRAQPGGGWIVELNNDTLPRVLVNNHYYARISREARNMAERQYISECFQSANWLVKSMHQRATTILRVAAEIVSQQDSFFSNGVRFLRPLVLRDIAQVVEMHESTVSRVTSNKYMATPRGIYELKYFFSPAINSSSGGVSHSAEAVRHRMKALIDGESAIDVLSDDRIVESLRSEGVDIARRTVAKYREALGIPSSVQRRRDKSSTL